MQREIAARVAIIERYRLFQYAIMNILTQCVGGAVRIASVVDSLDAIDLEDVDVVLVDLDPAHLDACEVARFVAARSGARVVAFAQRPQSVNERNAPRSLVGILPKDVDQHTFGAEFLAAISGQSRPGIGAEGELRQGVVAYSG